MDLELRHCTKFISNIQTLVSGGKISNQGTFNNVDPGLLDWEFHYICWGITKHMQQELHLDQG
jgi:hypothetical protein